MKDVRRQINGQSASWQHCGWLVPKFLGQMFDEELVPDGHHFVEQCLAHFGVHIIKACKEVVAHARDVVVFLFTPSDDGALREPRVQVVDGVGVLLQLFKISCRFPLLPIPWHKKEDKRKALCCYLLHEEGGMSTLVELTCFTVRHLRSREVVGTWILCLLENSNNTITSITMNTAMLSFTVAILILLPLLLLFCRQNKDKPHSTSFRS